MLDKLKDQRLLFVLLMTIVIVQGVLTYTGHARLEEGVQNVFTAFSAQNCDQRAK